VNNVNQMKERIHNHESPRNKLEKEVAVTISMNISQLKKMLKSLEYEAQVKRQEEKRALFKKNCVKKKSRCEFEQAQNKRKRRGNLSKGIAQQC
jgi:uncharacterized membrane-anchored protein